VRTSHRPAVAEFRSTAAIRAFAEAEFCPHAGNRKNGAARAGGLTSGPGDRRITERSSGTLQRRTWGRPGAVSTAEGLRLAVAAGLGPRLDRERFQWTSLALLAPTLAMLGVLFVFPVLYACYLGFTNLALVGSRSRDYDF